MFREFTIREWSLSMGGGGGYKKRMGTSEVLHLQKRGFAEKGIATLMGAGGGEGKNNLDPQFSHFVAPPPSS